MSSPNLRPGTTYPALVGGVLARLRENAGLRQAELAARVGVTQATWSRIENGSSALTIEQLGSAASVLQVPAHYVLQLADDAASQLRAQGATIELNRDTGGLDAGIALIGAAALGGLIAALILNNK